MSCEDILMIELVVGLKVLNIDCIGEGGKKEQKMDGLEVSDRDGTKERTKEENTLMWTYIIQTLEMVFIIFSPFISAKNRHNIKHFTKLLPEVYTSNKTFIAHMFIRKPLRPAFNFTVL